MFAQALCRAKRRTSSAVALLFFPTLSAACSCSSVLYHFHAFCSFFTLPSLFLSSNSALFARRERNLASRQRIFSTLVAHHAKPYDVPGPHMVRSTHRGTQQRSQKCVVFSLSRPVIFQTQCGLWRTPTSRSGYCVSGAFLRIFPGKTSQKSHFCCFCGALRGWGGIATFSSILGCSDKSFLMFFLGGPLQFF